MKIRTLLVDDFELMRRGIATALKSDSAIEIVGQAAAGEEALRPAHAPLPAAVLLALQMPGPGGMHALERPAADLPDTRVLVTTACAKGEALLDALAQGASGYLRKNLSPSELCGA